MSDYVFVIQSAFSRGDGEEGWDYQSAMDLINSLQSASVGRLYADPEGNVVYESRTAR